MCFKYCERALNNYVVHEEELKAIGQAKNVKKFWENWKGKSTSTFLVFLLRYIYGLAVCPK